MAKKKPQKKKSAAKSLVKEWAAKAPEIRGLRRPGTRAKAMVLLQQMEARGDTSADAESLAGMAEFVADVDELLGVLGGDAYIEWIESVPMDDALQFAVLVEVFTSKVAPSLGKD